MIIELENGQKLELPEGAKPEEIDDAVSHFQQSSLAGNTQSASVAPSQPSPKTDKMAGMKEAALAAVHSPDNAISPLARATAYGANYVSAIPGLKELGSTIAAGLGAGEGDTFAQRYNNLEDAQAAMREAGKSSNPDMTGFAKASGMVEGLGLGAAALPKTMAAGIANFAKSSPYLANLAVGVPTGALYGFADGTDESSRLSGAGSGALTSAALALPATFLARNIVSPVASAVEPYVSDLLGKFYKTAPGAAVSGALKSAGNAIDNILGETPAPNAITDRLARVSGQATANPSFESIPSAAELRTAGGQVMRDATQSGAKIDHTVTNQWLNDLKNSVTEPEEVGQALGVNPAKKIVDGIVGTFQNKPMTIDTVAAMDSRLGEIASQHVNPATGKLDSVGNQIKDFQIKLRQHVMNASAENTIGGADAFKALQEGRKAWAQSYKLNDIEKIITRASLSEQPVTAIKTGLRTMLANPNRLIGYSTEEIAALQKAAKTGILTDIMRLGGSRLGPLLSAAAGQATGGPLGSAVAGGATYGASSLMRNAATNMQMGKVDALRSIIAAPYMQSAAPAFPNTAGGMAAGAMSRLPYNDMLSSYYQSSQQH